MLYVVNASLKDKLPYLTIIDILDQLKGLEVFKGASELQKVGEIQAPSPQQLQQRKGVGQSHDHKRNGFRWCWRSVKLSSLLYMSNTVQSKVDGPLHMWCTRRHTT